jgi:hypothetical protein
VPNQRPDQIPQRFERGDRLRAADLNAIAQQVLRSMSVGPGLTLTSSRGSIALGLSPSSKPDRPFVQFQVQSESTDHLVCRRLYADGSTLGTGNVLVMKPPTLQGSTTGAYAAGDTIFARETNVSMSAGGTKTMLIDVNVDGRGGTTLAGSWYSTDTLWEADYNISTNMPFENEDFQEGSGMTLAAQGDGHKLTVGAALNGATILVSAGICWTLAHVPSRVRAFLDAGSLGHAQADIPGHMESVYPTGGDLVDHHHYQAGSPSSAGGLLVTRAFKVSTGDVFSFSVAWATDADPGVSLKLNTSNKKCFMSYAKV